VPANELEVNACSDLAFHDPYNCSQYLNKAILEADLQKVHGHKFYAFTHANSDKYKLPTPSAEAEE
jgi:hypothetical protein